MDPISNRPPLDGEPEEPIPEIGLVDLVDQALVRLYGLRDRPRLSFAVTALLVFGLAAGWGLTQWRAVEPIDDRIPRIDEVVAVEAEAAGTPSSGPAADSEPTPAPTSTLPEQRLVIHVSGAVLVEGLVELRAGSRLADAVTAAGGPTATADLHRLNLATPLVDGMHIRVPEVGEERDESEPPLIELATVDRAASDITAGGSGEAGTVNVNTAVAAELERLPGVGPAIAAAIVAWREDNGPFGSVDDLLDVPGIGPAKLAAIEEQVRL